MRAGTMGRLLGMSVWLALGCRVGLAQIGPRYVLELAFPARAGAAPAQGTIALRANGMAIIAYHGLRIVAASTLDAGVAGETGADLIILAPVPSDGGAVAPGAGGVPLVYASADAIPDGAPPVSRTRAPRHPMRTWDTLSLRKGEARLRVTAMPGRPGTAATAGFLVEVGTLRANTRIYVSGAPLDEAELADLPRRLPGADLALLPGAQGPRLAVLRPALPSPGAAPAGAGYTYRLSRR